MARQKGTDFDTVTTSNKKDKVKITDIVSIYKFPEKKWVTIRLYGAIHSYATAWITSKNKEGKKVKFPVDLPSYDPETQQFDSTKYDPWRDYADQERDSGVERDKMLVQVGKKFYCNALFRHLQKQQPSTTVKPTAEERKSGFKDKDSDTWTPWQVVALSGGLIGKIKELKGLNTFTSKKTGATKTYSVADEKYGRDIRVFYDSSKAPADQYQIVPGDKRTPLTEEELAFLRWDTSELASELPSDEETKREFESWAKRMGIKLSKGKARGADDIDEDEDDDTPKSKKSKAKPSKKPSKPADDEDEDDEDGDGLDDDEDEDEDEPPKSKKKPAPKGKKKPVEDDEDDEDDEDSDEDEDDDLDDDEDDEPKSKKKPAAKGKKKPVDDEDEDEDSDDEDDDLDDDEDEDDEPPKKSSKKAPAKGKKKPVDDDEDEDEDDDLDDDEDEEDEPPKKSSKKAAPAKKTSKKKPVDDDEDDDDL